MSKTHGIACAILTFLVACLVVSCWLQIGVWETRYLLDDSWRWATSRMRLEGLFLGKDAFFTYGPLSQYVGPLIEDGQRASPVFYLVGVVFLVGCVSSVWTIIRSCRLTSSAVGVLLFLGLLLLPSAQLTPLKDSSYYFLITVLYLAFYLRPDKEKWLFHLGMLFAACLVALQVKFSFGLYAVALFVIALMAARERVGIHNIAAILVSLIVAQYALFFLLTGSLEFHRFFRAGWVFASRYSEFYSWHYPESAGDLRYPVLLGYSLVIVVFVRLIAKSNLVAKEDSLFLSLSGFVTAFFFFKAGCSRADPHHIISGYNFSLPILALLASLSFSIRPLTIPRSALTALGLVAALSAYQYELSLSNLRVSDRIQKRTQTWLKTPERTVEEISLLSRGFDKAKERRDSLRKLNPELAGTLSAISEKRKAGGRITVLPWELMLAELAPSCRFSPIPSLTIPAGTCTFDNEALVKAYLNGPRRPDIVVLAEHTLDGRNAAAEYTSWIDPLHRKYRISGATGGYTVLELSEGENPAPPLEIASTGPGLFVMAEAAPLDFWQNLLYAVVKTLFKPPELETEIVFVDGRGTKRKILARCYRSQLVKPTAFAPQPIGPLLADLKNPEKAAPSSIIARTLSASVIRRGGFRNISVFPERVPLKIRYCRPAGFGMSDASPK